METINVQSAVQAAVQLKAAFEALSTRRIALCTERVRLRECNMEIYRSPILRSEAKQAIFKAIDRSAAEFPKAANWGTVFSNFAYPKGQRPAIDDESHVKNQSSDGPINIKDFDAINKGQLHILGGVPNFMMGAGDGEGMDARLAYFFFGDVIKKRVEQYFETMFPAIDRSVVAGKGEFSIEKKREQIAANDAQIAAIDQELETIAGQLKELEAAGLPQHPTRFTGA